MYILLFPVKEAAQGQHERKSSCLVSGNTGRCLVLQAVSGEYQETVSDTLKSLEQDLNQSLHHISLPSEADAAQRHDASLQPDTPHHHHQPPQSASPPHEEPSSAPRDASSRDSHSFFQDLTARVEYLINVRTTLVDAANGMFGTVGFIARQCNHCTTELNLKKE